MPVRQDSEQLGKYFQQPSQLVSMESIIAVWNVKTTVCQNIGGGGDVLLLLGLAGSATEEW